MRSKVDERTKEALEDIGAALRKAREAAGLSQAQLAESISMGRENYAKIERAEVNVTMDTLVRISDGLGLALVVGFSQHPKPKPKPRRRE